MAARLPDFVEPMLAELGDEPFDSPEHLFEIKWDGVRALAFVEDGRHRLVGRSRADYTLRSPELSVLGTLPAGTLLDGELVAWRDGRPDFGLAMGRIHAKGAQKIRGLSTSIPLTYVAFDLLYRDFQPLLERPLFERRAALAELLAGQSDPRLVFSDGVVGEGLAFFREVRAQRLEGLVAKRLASPYRPGRRSDEWIKIKPRQELVCAVIGYVAEGDDLRSLVIAIEEDGRLVPVGRVGGGMSAAVRARLLRRCRARERATPLVGSDPEATWIQPGLFCTVSYLERMEAGLRAPIFLDFFERP